MPKTVDTTYLKEVKLGARGMNFNFWPHRVFKNWDYG